MDEYGFELTENIGKGNNAVVMAVNHKESLLSAKQKIKER